MQDSRAAVRVPFTQIVPTVAKVVDTSNEGSSGAGWSIGEGGLVRPGLAGWCRARPVKPLPALTRLSPPVLPVHACHACLPSALHAQLGSITAAMVSSSVCRVLLEDGLQPAVLCCLPP